MGNWRSVDMMGACDASEVEALREAIRMRDDFKNFHCLTDTGGIFSLGDWPAEKIDRVGNLAERDYSVESIAKTLRNLVMVAPSLRLTVHCGGDNETEVCEATILVEGGEVNVVSPEVLAIRKMSDQMAEGRMALALMKNATRPKG